MVNRTPVRPKPIQGGEWVARFIFISGRLCLDFAETGGAGEQRAYWERLHQPSDLSDWFAESDLQLAGVEVTRAELQTALELREAIWQAAQAARKGETPRAEDIACINRAAAQPGLAAQLDGEAAGLSWRAPQNARVTLATAALSAVARDAVDLFSGELRTKIRECENPNCGLIFVDASRPGKRRWCLMERCGNRAKTRRYRQRRGEQTAD